jgi:hypothetical protein
MILVVVIPDDKLELKAVLLKEKNTVVGKKQT